MSRTAAVKAARGRRIGDELRQRGVLARATGRDALAEEMPEAYKTCRTSSTSSMRWRPRPRRPSAPLA